jgi:hypothetical protein
VFGSGDASCIAKSSLAVEGDQLSRVALVEERRAGLHAADGVLDERHGRPGQTA